MALYYMHLILILGPPGQPGCAHNAVAQKNTSYCEAHFQPLLASHLPPPKSRECTVALSIKAGTFQDRKNTSLGISAQQHSTVPSDCSWGMKSSQTAFESLPLTRWQGLQFVSVLPVNPLLWGGRESPERGCVGKWLIYLSWNFLTCKTMIQRNTV
jgi:hypothetical protein